MRLFGILNRQTKGTGKETFFSLIVLVMVAVVPLLVFGSGVAWMIVDQKKAAVAKELAGTARALRVVVDRELVSQFKAMEILASDASLDTSDLAGFQHRASRAIKANGEWLNIGLIDPHSHRIIVGTHPVPTTAPTSLSPRHVDQVVRTRKPVIVGPFSSARITRGPIILLMSPVLRNNEVRYVLGVAMNPKTLSDIFAEQHLASTWTGAILDTELKLAGRSRDPERYIGVRATQSLVDRIAARASGMFTAKNQEGATVYTVFSRSPLTGWSVAIGVPANEVEGPIKSTLLQLTAVGGALITLALILTGLVGRVIVRRRDAYEGIITESESRFRIMADSAPVAIWISDTNRRCTWVNQMLLDFTGQSRAQLLGNGWAELIHPDDLHRCFGIYETAFDNLQPFTNEFRLLRADGQYRWIMDNAVPLYEQGVFKGFIGSGTDLTDRKLTEEALKISEERYRAVVEDQTETICRYRADGTYIFVNDIFCRFFGKTRDEILRSSWHPDALPDDVPVIEGQLRMLSQSNPVVIIENRVKLVGGEVRWMQFVNRGFLDDEGRLVETQVVGRDITERKHAEEMLANSNTRLEQQVLERTASLTNALRQLHQENEERKRIEQELLDNQQKLEAMSIELSMAEERERDRIAGELHDQVGQNLILSKMILGALAQDQSDDGLRQVEKLDRIIDLSIQEIRSLTFQLRPPLLASAGLEAALSWLGEELQEKHGLHLAFFDDGQQKPMRYEARSTVFQAAREMLLNTIKHAKATTIGIEVSRKAEILLLRVSDNGCGFDPAEAGSKKTRSGGFGLNNVRRRIEYLGGSVTIDSSLGNGTLVTIVVPLDIFPKSEAGQS